MDQTKRLLIQALAQSLGNKVYLRDIEKLLEKVDLLPQESQALKYLAQDIKRLSQNKTKVTPF